MQPSGWRSYGAFVFGKNGLVALCIFWLYFSFNIFWKWGFAQFSQFIAELFIRTIKKETKRSSAGCGVVYHFCYKGFVITEIKFVANPYFSGRIYQNVPKTGFRIQFPQKENFNASAGFFFVAEQTRRKNLCIIGYQHITLFKIIN